MKNKKLLFGVCLSLLVGTAALTTSSALSATEPQNDVMLANVEALTSNEGSGGCEVSIGCSVATGNDYIKCSGQKCERNASERWVKCDGVKTSC